MFIFSNRERFLAAMVLIVAVAGGCEESQPPLSLQAVLPEQLSTDRATPIVIQGSFYTPLGADLSTGRQHLRDEFLVELGGEPLSDVEALSEQALSAVVPAQMPLGAHTLVVVDPLEREASLEGAVTICPADESRPRVVITGHDAGDVLLPGESFLVLFSAVDEPPGRIRRIEWTVTGAANDWGERELTEPLEAYFGAITVELPDEPDPERRGLMILIMAEDDAPTPNQGSARLDLLVTFCTSDVECDDRLFCNGEERCVEGNCVEGRVLRCDDGVDCTVDTCDEDERRCAHSPRDVLCDDQRYCTGVERCDAVEGCLAGTPPCVDGVECTADYCEEAEVEGEEGHCRNVPEDSRCDDAIFCNGVERCVLGYGCVDGEAPCSDAFECTESLCFEETRYCQIVLDHDLCRDGDDCTRDRCDKDLGCLNVPETEGPFPDPTCTDGADNDCDGLRDLVDPDCQAE